MRYNNVKFIEPLAAAADALTPRQAHEMASRASGTRRRLRQAWMAVACAVLVSMMGSPLADHHGGQPGHSVMNLKSASRQPKTG